MSATRLVTAEGEADREIVPKPTSAELIAAHDRVIAEIRGGEKFLLVTHENPDGDALGSIVAMQEILTLLGKDSLQMMAADEFPLPYEYRFMDLSHTVHAPPADISERTLIFLDCGNLGRNALGEMSHDRAHTLNIDHHHDNTRFAAVNYVVPHASSTAEIVWYLMRDLGLDPTPEIAQALYVGLITDTGRFMYDNTGSTAHHMASELLEAGVDVHAIYKQVYEEVPFAKVKLFGVAMAKSERFDDGVLTVTQLTAEDFASTGADEGFTEGIVDMLRAVSGTRMAVFIREKDATGPDGEQLRKASLRSSDSSIDVSSIARSQGGGGHPQAAGFTTSLSYDELVDSLRAELQAQLS